MGLRDIRRPEHRRDPTKRSGFQHLDHGDEETCYDCIESGFYSSVMIDASSFPFEENVAITRRVVDRAHASSVSVEAELGQLGGVEEDISVDEDQVHLTDPKQAAEFIECTGCDSLACAIGTSHGAYKFTRKPDGSIFINTDLCIGDGSCIQTCPAAAIAPAK